MPGPEFHPVMTCAEARAFEGKLFAGDVSGEFVRKAMRLAAEGVARETRALLGEAGLVGPALAVLAGKGRNAGDALLAAALLLPEVGACGVILVAGEPELAPETRDALDALREAGGERVRVLRHGSRRAAFPAGPVLILDGLAGSGFRPPLSPEMRSLIGEANALPDAVRVAVDLPSGAGDDSDGLLFRADLTVATGIFKSPLLGARVRESAGRLRYADTGFFSGKAPSTGPGFVVSGKIFAPLRTLRPASGDKRAYGHVLVVGGSDGMPGAALLNTRAALHAGAGLVTTVCPERVQAAFAAAAPEAMWVGATTDVTGGIAFAELGRILAKARRADALVLGSGCGDSPDTRRLLAALVAQFHGAVTIDADALRPEVIAGIADRPATAGPVVLTPHAGEFLRIAGVPASPEAAVAFAAKTGATVVMKGPGTTVCYGRIHAFVPFGGPAFARGGSGDLLAGIVGALLAREHDDVFGTVCRAVAWHGAAADAVAGRRGATTPVTGDILDGLESVVRDWRPA